MRWFIREPEVTPLGSKRTVIRFLLWPRRLGQEVRWLEFVMIEQEFREVVVFMEGGGKRTAEWCDNRFVD